MQAIFRDSFLTFLLSLVCIIPLADFTKVVGQNVTVTCNYSTPYPIPESSPTEYYLYDGIDLTINTFYRPLTAVILDSVQITRIASLPSLFLFRGFFGAGTPSFFNAWAGRCTHTFDQDDSCDPCEFSVTLSGYNTSTDDAAYVSAVGASSGTESCTVNLEGTQLNSMQ